MAKDSLADALYELKERERKQRKGRRRSGQPRPKRGRPKAFDSFYIFAQMLIAFGILVQIIAFLMFA